MFVRCLDAACLWTLVRVFTNYYASSSQLLSSPEIMKEAEEERSRRVDQVVLTSFTWRAKTAKYTFVSVLSTTDIYFCIVLWERQQKQSRFKNYVKQWRVIVVAWTNADVNWRNETILFSDHLLEKSLQWRGQLCMDIFNKILL